jgi:hypothetical protein
MPEPLGSWMNYERGDLLSRSAVCYSIVMIATRLPRWGDQTMSSKRELEAEIRNKLSMPLVVLDMMRNERKVSREKIELAINNLKTILQLLQADQKRSSIPPRAKS